jgi:hypothetical protein
MGLIVNEQKTKYVIVSATQKGRQTQNWKVGDKVFERVSSFIYLDNVMDKEGRISERVKDIIQVGNRAYAANHHTLKSNIIKRSVKMQIYRVSQEERTKLREGVPYVKLYRYNSKHLCPKLNGY